MLEKNTDFINKAMNVVLLFLFISSIALIVVKYSISGNLLPSFSKMDLSLDGKLLRKFILPNKIVINFSKDSATVMQNFDEEILDEGSSALREAFLGDMKIEKVDNKTYNSQKKFRNISFEYGDIPSEIVEKNIGLKDTSLGTLGNISSITYMLGNDDNKTIYIKSEKKIYKINKNLPNRFSQVDMIEKTSYIPYYSIFTDDDNNKDILIPINPYYKKMDFEKIPIFGDVSVDNIAKAIFGDKLDFATYSRRVDGSYLYSYKNGQRVMSIGEDGFLEYRNDSVKIKKNISAHEAVLMAIEFLDSIGMSNSGINIASLEESQTNNVQSIRLNFKRNTSRMPIVMYKDGIMENITINNGVIQSCQIFLHYMESLDSNEDIVPLLNPLKALDRESSFIQESLNLEKSSDILFYVEDIKLVYQEKSGSVIPSWFFKTPLQDFIIDARQEGQDGYL